MEQQYNIGDTFQTQFVWRLPDKGDVIRAIFEAEVLAIVEGAMKYMTRLTKLAAARQESYDGNIIRSKDELNVEYWPLVVALVGRKVTIAYEIANGQAVYLRLATLTGEHDFFSRYNQVIDD